MPVDRKFSWSWRTKRLVGLAAAVLVSSILNVAAAGSTASAGPPEETRSVSDTQVDQSLDALAKAFAVAVADPEVRGSIHEAVAQRFDGDTNALWTSLKNESDVRNSLEAAYSEMHSASKVDPRVAIDGLAAQVPRLQVAVPAHFDSWDPVTYAPLVAYASTAVDDTDLKHFTAYDAEGKAHTFDAWTTPKQPIIVLGQNERTDDAGRLLNSKSAYQSQTSATTAVAATAAAARASYQVRMVAVFLNDDKEPVTGGAAEISMKARSRGCSGTEYIDTDWSGLNYTFDSWEGARYLGSTTCDVVFYWWEDDGGSFDFTLGFGGFSLGVRMDNSDDLIGGIQLPYSSFEGGSNLTSQWSALLMVTD